MVTVREKKIGNKVFYYLEHSFRKNGKVKKKEIYLGKKVPENIEELKKHIRTDILKEKWMKKLDKIKKDFSAGQKNIPKSVKERELNAFLVKFTYDTQKIEGSTLSLRETADLLDKGITPKAKKIDDAKEAESHKNLFLEIMKYKKDISMQTILHWHKIMFQDTKTDIAGKLRKHQVRISGSRFMPPLAVEIYPLLKDFFKWYAKQKNKIHPVELAALAHLKFVTIHPFSDGNGRISRLLMNFILQKYKFPMVDISYEKRAGYYNSLEKSQIKETDYPFLRWFFKYYVKCCENYLNSCASQHG